MDKNNEIVLDRRNIKNTDYNIVGDFVECMNCGRIMLLDIGTDICPVCDEDGTLSWIDNEKQEVTPSELEQLGYLLTEYLN